MNTNKLAAIRKDLEATQERMAELLGCSLVGYKRFELGMRPIPAYIAVSAKMLAFLHKHGLLKKFESFAKKT
jgi:transcriptional regulator with XRE-family HTH domain